jgi:hypothetical protein
MDADLLLSMFVGVTVFRLGLLGVGFLIYSRWTAREEND